MGHLPATRSKAKAVECMIYTADQLKHGLREASLSLAGWQSLAILLLAILATCQARGSSVHIQFTGDPDPTTERCTPRQAKLQALLLKGFAESSGGW